MGPWTFVAPRFQKLLGRKVSRFPVPTERFRTIPLALTRAALACTSAAVGQPAGAARPRRRHRHPPSAATGGHSHSDLPLRPPEWMAERAALRRSLPMQSCCGGRA